MKIEEELDGRFRNEYHKGMINLIYTTNLLNYDFLQTLKQHDLTSQQYNILKILRGFGKKPRNIEFLRARMLDKKSDISRIIDRLYNKGLIERHEASKDRRQKDITITKNALELLSKMDECEQKVDLMLKNLSENEVQILNELLDKIRG
jgi:DNA-binding MarR family transcriptional regulator